MSDQPTVPAQPGPSGPPQGGQPPVDNRPRATPGFIEVQEADGTPAATTAQELLHLYQNRKNLLSAEERSEYDLLKKAVRQNDPEALRTLMGQLVPPANQPPANPELAAMQEKIHMLETALGRVTPTVDQVRTQAVVQHLGQGIKQNAQTYPHLARDPNGANRVHKHFRELVAFSGRPWEKLAPQEQLGVLTQSYKQAEEEIVSVLQTFGAGAGTTPARQGVTAVDDQVPKDGRRASWYSLTRGQAQPQNPTGQPLPSQPVNNMPASSGVPQVPPRKQFYTTQELAAMMAAERSPV